MAYNLLARFGAFTVILGLLAGCGSPRITAQLPPATIMPAQETLGESYIIGPLDSLRIFVWRNPELSTSVTVRPDGRITTPLISDLPAAGKTSAQLAEDIKKALGEFIQNPNVQVIVGRFGGPFSQQVRVVGEATTPRALPYRANMTLLDAMIAVGGLTQYASGDRARLIRLDRATGKQVEYGLRINRLLKDADASYNVNIQPGDVIIIPESLF